MGIEYRLLFNAPSKSAIAAVLRKIPTINEPVPGERFELTTSDAFPAATIDVEAAGAYFCDHCSGSGRTAPGDVVSRLVSAFGQVTINEL